jgi:putative peptidoglycan binding protein
MKLVRLVLIPFVMGLLTPMDAAAAFQRMGIAAGQYGIAAGASNVLQAFCFDLIRDSPKPETDFSHILTPGSDATVMIGSGTDAQTMSLQQAIDQKKIKLHGTDPTFGELMDRTNDPMFMRDLPPRDREDLQKMAALWATATPDEKAEVEKRFGPDLAGRGDHTRIAIDNLTTEPVSIRLNSNAVVSPNSESLQGIPVGAISGPGSPEAIQKGIWKIRTTEHQQMLKSVGFYDGVATGDLDGDTKRAIFAFQKTEGLTLTGAMDPETEARLNDAISDQQTLLSFNNKKGQKWIAAIVQPGFFGGQFYRLSFGDDKIFYADSIATVRKTVLEQSGPTGANQVFLIADLPENGRAALDSSIEISALADEGPTDIRVVERQGSHRLASDEFFSKQIRQVHDDGEEPEFLSATQRF